jgi:hypothetical protein
MKRMGLFLIIGGISLAIIGLIIYFSDKLPFLGRLPGDIVIKKENFTFYFPLATSLVLSIILSLILYLVRKL